jgi:hypothetical protein
VSRDGSGTYSLPSGNPVVTGATISSSDFNTTMNDLASALTASIVKDGQTAYTGNQPMGTNKLTGLGNGSARTDSIALGQVQDGSFIYVGTVGGTADVITLTPSPAISSYVAGQTFRFIASGANTTNVTVAISGLAAKAVTKEGSTALIAGDIQSGAIVSITYDGTRFQMVDAVASGVAPGVLLLPAATSPAQTADGSIVWDSDDNLLTVGDGSSRKTMVDTGSTQTLTNKTLTNPTLTSPVLNTGISGDAIADQTAMEAASTSSLVVTPANMKYHPGVAKYWCKVTFSGGTPSIAGASASGGSLTDNGTGDTTVNFPLTFSSTATMCPVITVSNARAFARTTTMSTTGVKVVTENDANVAQDIDFFIAVFGDL